MSNLEEDTIDWVVPKTFADHFFASQLPKFEVGLAAATHPGRVRPHNEDHYAVIRRTRSCEIVLTNIQRDSLSFPDDQAYSLVVADGIGGAAFGEVASQVALNTMLELAGRATSWVMKFTDLDAQDLRHRVDAYVEQVQRKFRECSQDDPRLSGMGTTLTCAYLLPPHVVFAHIGDSRAYLQSRRSVETDHPRPDTSARYDRLGRRSGGCEGIRKPADQQPQWRYGPGQGGRYSRATASRRSSPVVYRRLERHG